MRVRFPPRAHGKSKTSVRPRFLFFRPRESKDGVSAGERVGVARFFTRKILVTDSRPGHTENKKGRSPGKPGAAHRGTTNKQTQLSPLPFGRFAAGET